MPRAAAKHSTSPGTDWLCLSEPLHRGRHCEVWRATLASDRRSVIARFTRKNPSKALLAQLAHEHAVLQSLDCAGVARPVCLEKHPFGLLSVVEDCGAARSLRDVIAEHGQLPLEEFFPLAIQAAELLGTVHQECLAHRKIRPSNILVRDDGSAMQLIDFRLAAQIAEERHALDVTRLDAATLAYVSPEQTGRMHRLVDYRTDMYSLGVTLYELLSGMLPLTASDASGWIHAHIAIRPTPLEQHVSGVPVALRSIIMRLLAKPAEDRYQSAFALKYDLARAFADWKSGRTPAVALGSRDASGCFRVPHRLYGREREIRLLQNVFEGAARDRCQMALVSGYSGVGKTALVEEARCRLDDPPGFFVTGKFDQFQDNIPYKAISDAFRNLVLQILAGGAEEIATWRQRIVAGVGDDLQAIVDVVPDLESIVGTQPPSQRLGPTEAHNRFVYVFARFVRALAGRKRSLVVFLDDMQWADFASLQLIESLLIEPGLREFLVVGAYRDNEVDADHALSRSIERAREVGGDIVDIRLGSLELAHLTQLVADTFECDAAIAETFAETLLRKTDGNPFFVWQFLRILHLENIVRFDFRAGCWVWDLGKVRGHGVSASVVDLMVRHLERLDDNTTQTLRLAACIGNQFDLATLAVISESAPDVVKETLQAALAAGLIVETTRPSPLLGRAGGADRTKALDDEAGVFRFLHDRVQQAAYSLIADQERARVQLAIGRRMLSDLHVTEVDERLFEIVNHLSHGLELIGSQAELAQLVELNARAGRKAKASTAYPTAAHYFGQAKELLGEDRWETDPETALEIERELGECHYLSAEFYLAEHCFGTVLEHTDSVVEHAHVHAFCVQLYVNTGRMADAEATIKASLALFGHALPDTRSELASSAKERHERIDKLLESRNTHDILQVEKTVSPEIDALLKFGLAANAPAYFISNELHANLMLVLTEVALRSGNSEYASGVYMGYAIIMSKTHRFDEAYTFGELALALDERFGNPEQRFRNLGLFGDDICLWKQHARTSRDYLLQGFDGCVSVGDLYWAAVFAGFYLQFLVFDGTPLDEVSEEIERQTDFLRNKKDAMADCNFAVVRQAIANLQGRTTSELSFSDESLSEETLAAQAEPFNWSYAWYALMSSQSLYLFGEYGAALDKARTAFQYQEGLLATPLDPLLYFYYSLALAATLSTAGPDEQEPLRQQLDDNHRMLAAMAAACPDNFAPLHHIVSAEIEHLDGNNGAALESYCRALEASRQSGFVHFEGIACERAGRLQRRLGLPSLAASFLRRAQECYEEWGATRKVEHMRTEYGELLGRDTAQLSIAPIAAAEAASLTTSPSSLTLDHESVLKAAQAISGEIVTSSLLERLLAIVLENAGGQRGVLILERHGELVVQAQATTTPESKTPDQTMAATLPEENAAEAPCALSIVRYVQGRRETLVLHDAANDARFREDPYVLLHEPKSVLCAPILRHGGLTGIVYLENNLASDAFTPERCEVLTLLTSQAAISLENARLYEDLDIERQRLDRIVRETPALVCGINAGGLTTFINPAGEQITGYAADELIGQDWWRTLYPGEDHAQVAQLFDDFSHGPVRDYEMVLTTRDGGKRTISWNLIHRSPGDDGSASEIVGFGNDITARRTAEKQQIRLAAQLRQSQKMETIGTLAGGIAHDFNNILMPILGYADMARASVPANSAAHGDLERVITAARRARDLVQQILTVGRRTEQQHQPVLLQGIVVDALQLLRASLPATIELREQIQFECDPVVADATQIHQIVMNLCTNAAQAIGAHGGLINVGVEAALVDAQFVAEHPVLTEGPHVRISVEDTGTGMSSDIVEHAFEPFFTTKEVGKGTGLGLSVVHGIVAAHGGEIVIESQVGRGTKFEVYLPATEPEADEDLAPERPDPRGAERILYVDDEKAIVLLAQKYLPTLGYRVVGATNGADALSKLRDNPDRFDLLITDQTMPGMTGVKLASAARAVRPDLPILLMTGHSEDVNNDNIKALGIDALLMKPVVGEALGHAVRAVIDGNNGDHLDPASCTKRGDNG